MSGWLHFVQGTIASGAKSPGIKTFAPHPPQVTIRNGLRVSVDADIYRKRYHLL